MSPESSLLTDHFRTPGHYAHFKIALPQKPDAGYFRFGDNAVCYGRTSTGTLKTSSAEELYDIGGDITVNGSDPVLPFSPDEVINNLRYERYVTAEPPGVRGRLLEAAKETYYFFRPLMPVRFRKHLQRVYLSDWHRISFPRWPVDCTVENIFDRLLVSLLKSHHLQKVPFVWFWPDGYSACAIMTHDIETEAGRDFSIQLAKLDASFGIKPSFQVVPEKRYEVTPAFLDSLRARGCEVNLHGLNHDGQLFRDRKEFLRQVKHINRYAREFGASGFRSPVMYRNLEWYGDFELSYDMSVPNVAHAEPQRGGCCTVMPYFVGDLVELPLTTTQDYVLFNILNERSTALWKQQIQLIVEKHGLISFNIHPDYMIAPACRDIYRELLDHLVKVCAEQRIWTPLPGDVDRWWRRRREMHIVKDGHKLRIVGPSSERAMIAYACWDGQRIVYELPSLRSETVRSSA